MNKSILDALMRLFAIIADVKEQELSGRARAIVESYLKRQFHQEFVAQYLSLFDKYLAYYHNHLYKNKHDIQKETASRSVKVLMICQQINEELELQQKVLVVLELFEFARENYQLTNMEYEFIKTVGDTFNIDANEFDNMRAFITQSIDDIPYKNNVLIINSNRDFNHPEFKHIYNPSLNGRIVVLHIKSTNTFVFKYLGKRNLYLNGHNIKVNRTYVLAPGAVLKSSRIRPIYYGNVALKFYEDPSKSKIIYRANQIEFKFRDSNDGIHRFSFHEESGQLVGIMGGSGVGKSTLLNLMNGNIPPLHGKITINGYDLHANKQALEGVIGYVPQDDLLIEELTVYQNLYYNAKLCFKDFNNEQIKDTVERAIQDFDLVEAKDLKVGNPINKYISGGQRKRLNIALELIRQPSVLFVDEPTSGLSSMDSEKVMMLLKRQTIRGKLVIANIHQPSSDVFKLFDRLLVMDKGGRIIYNGNPIDAIIYFKTMSNHVDASESECLTCGNVNTEQILRIVEARVVNEYGKLTRIRKVSPQEWYEMYLENIESRDENIPKQNIAEDKKLGLPKNDFKIPGKFKQFRIFCIRNILAKIENTQYLLINFLEAPILAIILGYFTKFLIGTADNPYAYIFSENKNFPAYLFMSVIVALFMGLTVSVDEIFKDAKILKRESFLNLSRFSYINSKVFVLFIISAIQTLTYVLIGNHILNIRGMTLYYWLVLFSTSCSANIIGLIISSSLNSVVSIYIMVPFVLVPQMLFSGAIVNFNDLHKRLTSQLYVPMIGDFMTSRWAYEALAVEQFKYNRYQKHFYKQEQIMSSASYYYGFWIPKLETKIDVCNRNIQKQQNLNETKDDLALIKDEFLRISKSKALDVKRLPFPPLNEFTPERFSHETAVQAKKSLEIMNTYFRDIFIKASKERDAVFKQLVAKLGDSEKVYKLKQDYHNKYLAKIVLNENTVNKIDELDGKLIQRKDPIYKLPEHPLGRSHLYAPQKMIGNVYMDTYWFNLLFIWLSSLILYLALLIDFFKRIVLYFEIFKSRFTKRPK